MSERINMAIETINHRALDNNCEKLAPLITRHTNGKGNGSHPTTIDKLKFRRESSASASLHDVCEPILVIVVQGKKTVLLGEETYHYGVAQYLMISVDLPLKAFVVQATSEQPYLGLAE